MTFLQHRITMYILRSAVRGIERVIFVNSRHVAERIPTHFALRMGTSWTLGTLHKAQDICCLSPNKSEKDLIPDGMAWHGIQKDDLICS